MIPLLMAVLAVLVIIAVMLAVKTAGKSDESVSAEEPQKSTDVFDDGRLKLAGSMEYEGPDFDDGSMEEGTYTMLKIQNISDSFLRNADIRIKVNGSEEMSLAVDSLPAGETVMVIGQGYDTYSEGDIYEVVSCESSYEESVNSDKENLKVSCEEGKIRLTNQSDSKMTKMTCRYKGSNDGVLLGGITYEFEVKALEAGETYETDSQCFLADSIQIVEIKE